MSEEFVGERALSVKERVFLVIGPPNRYRANKFFNKFLIILIIFNILAVLLQTVDSLSVNYLFLFDSIRLLSLPIFIGEYLLRLWVSDLHPGIQKGLKGRIQHIFSLFALVDLTVIVSSLVTLLGALDLRTLRVLRIVTLIRLLQWARYSIALNMLARVLKHKKPELSITFSIGGLVILFASTLMYYLEYNLQPDKFSSIPATMWWAVVTLSTVGYGDMHPVTPIGKILGATIILMGVGVMALPSAILASGFTELKAKDFRPSGKEATVYCPLCGSPQHEDVSVPTHELILSSPSEEEKTEV